MVEPLHIVATGDASATTPNLQEAASILKEILSKSEYSPLAISDTNEQLEAAMRVEMETRHIDCEQLERTLHLCSSFAEVAYTFCDFSEKKYIALLTWYLFYVDDMTAKDPQPFTEFEQRFLRGQPQLDPVLDVLVDLLLRLWEYYEPLCANFIIDSVFEFVTSTCIESLLEKATLIRGAQRFPWFVRHCTGIGQAYALLIFPKSAKFDIMDFVQALPEMDFWICMWNDILSFYKEELAGENFNYIHNRAYVDGKVPMQALIEIVDELFVARDTILASLAHCSDASKSWLLYERGYIQWHLAQDRYRLSELGI